MNSHPRPSMAGHFEHALWALEEVIPLKQEGIIQDAMMIRFRTAYEAGWRAIWESLQAAGVTVERTAECSIQAAYETGLIDSPVLWDRIRVVAASVSLAEEEAAEALCDFIRNEGGYAMEALFLNLLASAEGRCQPPRRS